MLKVKKKYLGKTMSNGKVRKFNTNDIDEKNYLYYFNNGFDFIFQKVKED